MKVFEILDPTQMFGGFNLSGISLQPNAKGEVEPNAKGEVEPEGCYNWRQYCCGHGRQ